MTRARCVGFGGEGEDRGVDIREDVSDSSDSDEDCVEEDDDRNKKCERSSGRAGTFGF
jgi:hypothetical protein